MQVVLGDVVESLGWHATTTGDVLEERPNLLGAFRPTKGEQQDGIKGRAFHYNSWVLAPPSA